MKDLIYNKKYSIDITGKIIDKETQEQVVVIKRKVHTSYKNNDKIDVVRIEVDGDYREYNLREVILEHYTLEEIQQYINESKVIKKEEQEEWKDIVGTSGRYKISNKGRVYSVPRLVENGFGKKQVGGKMLKINYSDYYNGNIVSLKIDNKKYTLQINVLLEEHFS